MKSRPNHEEIMKVRMSFHENGIKGISNRHLIVGAQYGGEHFKEGLSPERAVRIRKMLRTYHSK